MNGREIIIKLDENIPTITYEKKTNYSNEYQ